MVGLTTTPTQAWAILNRHARDDIAPLRLKDLCTDNDRVTSLVTVHSGCQDAFTRFSKSSAAQQGASTKGGGHLHGGGGSGRTLIVDLSRQRMTLETLNHLLRLATAVDVRGFIQTLAWGQNDRHDPIFAFSAGKRVRQRHFFGDEDGRDNGHDNGRDEDGGHGRYEYRYEKEPLSNHNNRPLSPSRSVATSNSNYLKKTRFAQHQHNQEAQDYDDLSTVFSEQQHQQQQYHQHSNPTTPSPSQSTLSPMNKVPLRTSPSMHMALRAPSHCKLQMFTANGSNALDDVHSMWNRIESVSSSIRKGQMKGVTGHILTNLLIVGKGVAVSGIQFIYQALKNDERGYNGLCSGLSDRKGGHPRTIRCLTTFDPVSIHSAISGWNPDKTCIISIALNEGDVESLRLTQAVKQWLINGLKPNTKREDSIIIGKHVLFVTASENLYQSQSVTKTDCSFLVPSFAKCEAFTTTSVAGLLPLSIAFGWDVVMEILNGAHDLDTHFVETNPRHNIPVLLALVDLWNDHFLPISCAYRPSGGKIITPFMDSFTAYPSFVATLESQVCGRSGNGGRSRNPYSHVSPTGLVVDGGLNGSLFDRTIYQGRRAPQNELVIAMEPQLPSIGVDRDLLNFNHESVYGNNHQQSNQDRLICSFFAHADVMALGCGGSRGRDGRGGASVQTGGGSSAFFGHGLGSTSFDDNVIPSTPQSVQDADISNGNSASSLLVCSRCDAFTVGQLIALTEHRALITAKLWDLEHFAFMETHGSNVRSKQVNDVTDKLEQLYQRLDLIGHVDEDEEIKGGPMLNLATRTLLGHYATTMHRRKNS
jgi:glucose-6-phosphate isomerase